MDFQGPWCPGHYHRREGLALLKVIADTELVWELFLGYLLEILCSVWLDFKVRMEFEASWYSVDDLLFHSLELTDVIQHFASHGLFLWTQSIEWWTATCFKQWSSQNITPFVETLPCGMEVEVSQCPTYFLSRAVLGLIVFANVSACGGWWRVFPVVQYLWTAFLVVIQVRCSWGFSNC